MTWTPIVPKEMVVLLQPETLPVQLQTAIQQDNRGYHFALIGDVMKKDYDNFLFPNEFRIHPKYTVYFAAHKTDHEINLAGLAQEVAEDQKKLDEAIAIEGRGPDSVEIQERFNALSRIFTEGTETEFPGEIQELIEHFLQNADAIKGKKVALISRDIPISQP